MIDHLLGRPSAALKRTQVFLVLLFWAATLLAGNKNGPPFIRRLSRRLRSKLTPWQLVAGTLTCLYAVKNFDSLLGLPAPEPLARLYSRDFYRATWIVTALDTGFATAMHVKPRWLRDIVSMLFSGYYLLFANEADEKLRKYRAICSVEMLRSTWEKTGNPIIRAVTFAQRPAVTLKRKIVLPRPSGSPYTRPVVAHLYFDGPQIDLESAKELMLDLPGGGFVCMGPLHHEERLLAWAKRTHRPVLALDYSKAPEYPYPYALHECFDVYRLLHETNGSVIGMHPSSDLRIVVSGDSAGANIGAAMMIKILEMPLASRPPLPLALIWTYPALDFNFTSFMPQEHLQILRHESSAHIKAIIEQKEHLKHHSPLSVVEDSAPLKHRRKQSWSKSFSKLPFVHSLKSPGATPKTPSARLPLPSPFTGASEVVSTPTKLDDGAEADNDGEGDETDTKSDKEKTISERVQYWNPDRGYAEMGSEKAFLPSGKAERGLAGTSSLGTRLTMTSRTCFFNDRIISPSMMRAMAICYVGPRNSPDLSKNYYISPILTPAHLLAQFPPVYLLCGERDPFSDDTLIFAGKLRDAKMAKKAELIAKQTKHGEGLRMSSSVPAERDPILDETDEDWVTTRFIEGWSHGFMQMVTLLPKVRQFFDLTADWASLAFVRYDSSRRLTVRRASPSRKAKAHIGEPGSASEKEEEVLSFKPKRRGSRTSSPVPDAIIRSQLKADLAAMSSSSSASETAQGGSISSTTRAASSLTSDSSSSSGMLPHSSNSATAKVRRLSPSDSSARAGTPVQKLLECEYDLTTSTSGAKRRSSDSSPVRPTATKDLLPPGSPTSRRPSDTVEEVIKGTAFVEAADLLKRRREDAVQGLGSALVSSDDD